MERLRWSIVVETVVKDSIAGSLDSWFLSSTHIESFACILDFGVLVEAVKDSGAWPIDLAPSNRSLIDCFLIIVGGVVIFSGSGLTAGQTVLARLARQIGMVRSIFLLGRLLVDEWAIIFSLREGRWLNVLDVLGEAINYHGVDVVLIAELLGQGDWVIAGVDLNGHWILAVQLNHHFHHFPVSWQLLAIFFLVIHDVLDDPAVFVWH